MLGEFHIKPLVLLDLERGKLIRKGDAASLERRLRAWFAARVRDAEKFGLFAGGKPGAVSNAWSGSS